MDNEKEISFGAFDSELMHQEIFIPEGFTATIEGDKIILRKTESEDERIRKALIEYFNEQCDMSDWNGVYGYQVVAWLEKQGEQKLPIEKLPEEMKTIGESLGFTTQEECDEYNQMVSDIIMSDDDKGEQKSADWSEEDEKIVNEVIQNYESGFLPSVIERDRIVKNLKSLKERYTWKPSDAQMEAFEHFIVPIRESGCDENTQAFNSLYNDLKKLKRE